MYEKNILKYFIFISLFLGSFQNEQKKIERIEGTIKLIISSIIGELNATSFAFEYKKYSISFDKFKLIKPLLDNIKINKENKNNEIFYKINKINITYIFDLGIKLFANPNNIITDKSRFIIANFEEIKFKFIDDYNIEFISSEISSINFLKNNKLNNLDYFGDFNEKKPCNFYESGKEPIKINDIDGIDKKIKDLFNKMFDAKIKELQKSINMLSYDILNISNNCKRIYIQDGYPIENFLIKKLKTKVEYMTYNKTTKSIILDNLIFEGDFYSGYIRDYVNFSFKCGKKFTFQKSTPFIFNRSESNNYIKMNIENCDYEDEIQIQISDQTEELKDTLIKEFPKYLNKIIDDYYKNIF